MDPEERIVVPRPTKQALMTVSSVGEGRSRWGLMSVAAFLEHLPLMSTHGLLPLNTLRRRSTFRWSRPGRLGPNGRLDIPLYSASPVWGGHTLPPTPVYVQHPGQGLALSRAYWMSRNISEKLCWAMKGGWIWCSRRKWGDFFQFSRTLNKGTDVGMILRHTGDFETHLFVWLVASGGFLVIMVGKRFFTIWCSVFIEVLSWSGWVKLL